MRAAALGGFAERGERFFLQFLELPGKTDTGGGGHAVGKENAVEMIHFMLQRAGEEAGAIEGNRVAREILRMNGDPRRPANIGGDFRDAQATFDTHFFTLRMGDFGVDENERHVGADIGGEAGEEQTRGPVAVTDINHGELHGPAHLLGGETDAVGGVHGFQHIGGELAQLRRDLRDALPFFAQDGVAVLCNFENHARSIEQPPPVW